MTIMNEEAGIDKTIEEKFRKFIKRFNINKLLRKIAATKEKGIPACAIFTFLLGLVFTHKNYYATFTSRRSNLSFGKDVAYRFLSRPQVYWEEFVPTLAADVIKDIDRLTSENRIKVWIFDDTAYYRDRSKKVELLSWCKDHSENRSYKGFTFLTMGWSDGVTFIPSDFRVVASGNDEKLIEGSHVKQDRRTRATKRRSAARTNKPALMLQMLDRAKHINPDTKHVLFDSWFNSPKAILDIKAKDYDVVARMKNNENYRYLYNGECLSISQIYKANKKRRGRSRYLLSVSAEVRQNDYDKTVPANIVFVRERTNRKKWFAIISTDLALSEEEIIALYGKRWDIEPYHKVIKSVLHLNKEFQLRSFDAIVAHASIVLTRYIFLALESRENKDDRSIGDLFMLICDELEDISFRYAFELLLSTLESCLGEFLLLSKDRINGLVSLFLASLPCFIKDKLRFAVCES